MKQFSIIISALLSIIILGYSGFRWVRYEIIDFNAMFYGCIAIAFLFHSLTWGDIYGENGKDELAQHIKTTSAKIGYFVLVVIATLTLFVSEGVTNLNEIKNMPLAFLVSLSFVVLPITEFIYLRKYR